MSKSKKESGGDAPNVNMSCTRIQRLGRSDTLQWSDIPEHLHHLYLQIGKRLIHKAGLSPQQLRKFDTPAVGTDGAPACAVELFSVGGHVRIISDRASPTDT